MLGNDRYGVKISDIDWGYFIPHMTTVSIRVLRYMGILSNRNVRSLKVSLQLSTNHQLIDHLDIRNNFSWDSEASVRDLSPSDRANCDQCKDNTWIFIYFLHHRKYTIARNVFVNFSRAYKGLDERNQHHILGRFQRYSIEITRLLHGIPDWDEVRTEAVAIIDSVDDTGITDYITATRELFDKSQN